MPLRNCISLEAPLGSKLINPSKVSTCRPWWSPRPWWKFKELLWLKEFGTLGTLSNHIFPKDPFPEIGDIVSWSFFMVVSISGLIRKNVTRDRLDLGPWHSSKITWMSLDPYLMLRQELKSMTQAKDKFWACKLSQNYPGQNQRLD